MIMGRGEPTLVPEWLKGAGEAGPSGVTSCSQAIFSEGDSTIFSRHRVSQQASSSGRNQGDYDCKHSSLTTDTVGLPATRRRTLASSGSRKEHLVSDSSRSYSFSGRLFPYLATIDGGKDASPRMQNHHFDWSGETDQDLLREKVVRVGIGDEKEKERERLENELPFISENSVTRWPMTTASSKTEAESVTKYSQGSRLHENGFKKPYETGNSISATSSVSVSLATSMHKAAFERNFPSLGSDEKQGGSHSSLGGVSHRPSWHGLSSRPDASRLLHGLTKSNGLPEGWSFTALADTPVLIGNMPSSGLVVNVSSSSGNNQNSTATPPVTPTNVMNMAEALVQNSPRVRTPPQPVLESQKLEELALKQSRQLIPVTPPLPKAIGADKGKPKIPSASKASQPLIKPCVNSQHRSATSVKSDMPKPTQGKLLVLKSCKDGGLSLPSNVKPDGLISTQTTSLVNSGAISTNSGIPSTRRQKQFGDNRASPTSLGFGCSVAEGGIRLRAWDSVMTIEDKRPTIARNRSEFFNTLRKKAASNGVSSFGCEKSDALCAQKNAQMKPGECDLTQTVDHFEDENHSGENALRDSMPGPQHVVSELHVNGDTIIVSGPADGLVPQGAGALCIGSTLSDDSTSFRDASIMGGSEEEEAAFLRSLGWEENAEGGEALTEEEINAFYQMRAKFNPTNAIKLSLNNCHIQEHIGSLGTISSGFSSSDSESDGETQT